ncbi:hypothetical protein [Streptomyces zaehneri]|uniref:hypothetical protein n=1 Tax=Streptomyces zaehneri TaxID=3051180 RepID=UPI0028D7DA97|nr:hypothetical protein [Streptomyces sp. DSM 40713]
MNRPDPHDRPASPPLPPAPPAPPGDNEDYSATVLASHWIQRPETDPTSVLDDPTPVEDGASFGGRTAVAPPSPHDDGTVLRFGPGVTAALARQPHRTLPTVPAPPALRRGRLRRYALPALVLVAAVLFLLWRENTGPGVQNVSVTAARDTLECDSTAGIVGVVRTDGRPGTLTYRWLRSDGTSSDVRHADVVRGQRTVRLELLWTFEGPGRLRAVAKLRVLTPEPHGAEVRFTYDCP